MAKISNALLKLHIDIRKIVFKPILDNFGGKLRIVLYGAAPMDKSTIYGYTNLGIALIQGYGLTETSPVISAETDKEKRPGSIGLPLDSLEVRIKNPDKDGVGEVEVKGPSVMLGYYENEKKTNEVLKDGWFSTGDYGYIDADGFMYITGRKNDIIVLRNGKNVYPSEIEFLINKVPYIVESMVFSRGENNTDTMLCAKIVYDKEMIEKDHPGADYEKVLWNDIKLINKELPTYKHVKKILITDIPMEKTTTQKIKRNLEISKIK
jgi:long-chain acyl-CoA synthetase